MNALEKFAMKHDNWVVIESPICSIAYSLTNAPECIHLKERISELIQSYFNQWRFSIEAYEKLYQLFVQLNQANDKMTTSIITDFDLVALQKEIEFKNYAYLFIVSLKSLLDLFTCIVDIIQSQVLRDEDKLPDFFKYGKRRNRDNYIMEIESIFDEQRLSNDRDNWVKKINLIRNKIIHRGYLLKPQIGFDKLEKLIIQIYKGTDFYSSNDEVDIGLLFSTFLTEMPILETKISDILIKEILFLTNQTPSKVTFRFCDLINEYNYD